MKSPLIKTGRQPVSVSPGAADDPTFFLPKVEPSRLFGALLRRGWIILLFGLLAGVAAWTLVSKIPKTYRATGSVYVSTQAPQVLDIRAVAAEESRDLEQLHSVEQDLSSTTVLLRVIKKYELLGDESFAKEAKTEQQVLEVLADRVNVELVRGSRNIEIAVKDTDPTRAQSLVESIMSEYEKARAERIGTITTQANEGLAKEEQRLRKKAEASGLEVEAFRKQNAVPGLDDLSGSSTFNSELGALNSQLTRAKSERLRLEAEYEAFKAFDPNDPDALAGLGRSDHAAEVLSLIRSVREKEVEFERLKERYLYKHPAYKEAANELGSLEGALAAAVRTAGEAVEKSYRVSVENQAKLEREVAQARSSAVDAESVRAEFAKLNREASADRELHAAIAKRLSETSLSSSVPASILSWRERPLAPEKAHGPRKMLLVPLALCGGLFFGLVTAVGLEMGDRRIRDAAAVSRVTGLPLLARLPKLRNSDGYLLLSEPYSEAAESFRRLGSMLVSANGNEGLQTVLFTSARSGEGKSLCALNHATSLAMQGYRTLLLDADMRNPGLSRDHLRENPVNRGLSDFLAGKAEAADACFRTSVPKLFLMSSGEMRDDAAELLSGTRFPALLEDAYRWFDRVVIDVPAVLSSNDALAIARYADRTCLVVGQDAPERSDLRQTTELLRSAGANPVGFVWNDGANGSIGPAGPHLPVSRNAIEVTPEAGSEPTESQASITPERQPESSDDDPTIPFPVEKKA